MDETKPAEQEHQHWWQTGPYEWFEEAIGPSTKRLTVACLIRSCCGCGEARVFVLGDQPLPADDPSR